MLERTTIYVDTSYLLASFYNSWEEGAREQLEVSLANVVQTLNQVARGQVNQQVHRQFWYDGVPDGGPHRYQRTLRVIDGVILRTGQLIEWGSRRSQKAVDTRLVADMVMHAFRGQCTDMVLVSGDADMIPGVEAAVEAGVRVHLVGFGWDSISSALRNACDTTTVLDPRTDFADSMQIRVLEGPLPPQVKTPRPTMPGDANGTDTEEPVELDEVDFRAERAKDDSVAAVREKLTADREAAAVAEDVAASEAGAESAHGSDNPADATGGAGHPGDEPVASDGASVASDGASVASDGDSVGAARPGPAAMPGAESAAAPRQPRSNVPGEPADQDDPAAISRPANERAEPAPKRPRSEFADADTCLVDAAAERGDADAVDEVDDHKVSVVDADAAPAAAPRGATSAEADEDAASRQHESHATLRVTRTQVTVTQLAGEEGTRPERAPRRAPRPNPSMMAPRRRPVRSRYVPLSEEVWSSSGEPTPYDVGQQYATWWYRNAADEDQRGTAHTLTGGALPPEIDRPLLQFACQTLHEFTLNEYQRVALRDGFHEGIRSLLMR